MNIGEFLDQRRENWQELERMCNQFRKLRATRDASVMIRFSELYRAACNDLAMADSYRLSPTTTAYLHQLVGRAHNQLYRAQRFQFQEWWRTIFYSAPKQIFADGCVHTCSMLFFGTFLLTAICAWSQNRFPNFAEFVLGQEAVDELEKMYDEPLDANFEHYILMSSFYIRNNTGIGLQCFATGPLIVPTLFTLVYNAAHIGTAFGYMARSDVPQGENFFPFVTAHGPFELTAIVLAAAAGLRLGLGLIRTNGLTRLDSLRFQAQNALPVMMASVVLFFGAAFTEGFISPSAIPYIFKAGWALASSFSLMVYFVVLGFPRGEPHAT